VFSANPVSQVAERVEDVLKHGMLNVTFDCCSYDGRVRVDDYREEKIQEHHKDNEEKENEIINEEYGITIERVRGKRKIASQHPELGVHGTSDSRELLELSTEHEMRCVCEEIKYKSNDD
jgi:hypothetical protein